MSRFAASSTMLPKQEVIVTAVIPEAATGWLRFGVTALPKTAPPCGRSPSRF